MQQQLRGTERGGGRREKSVYVRVWNASVVHASMGKPVALGSSIVAMTA